jgi:exosortase/archaeosortase family protein
MDGFREGDFRGCWAIGASVKEALPAARRLRASLLGGALANAWTRLAVLAAAIWPVWCWIFARASRDSGDAWALLSLATAAALLWRDRANVGRWRLAIALMLIYAVSFPFVPPLAHALIAMSALGAACGSLSITGLFLLAVPLVPTLNFYLGYPLRVVVGEAASVLLRLNGFAVVREGATLIWNGQQISIDAPCSGVKMLWTGMYLSCTLAALQRLGALRTVMLGALAFAIVMIANVLRATALFYVESGVVAQAQSAHESIGVVVFVLAAIGIAAAATRLRHAGATRRLHAS